MDDYERSEEEAVRVPSRARKKLMIKRGLDLLIDAGLFVPEVRQEATIFGRKAGRGRGVTPEVLTSLERVVKTARQEGIELAGSSPSF